MKLHPSPRVAFWLSLVVPGLGLAYAGAPLRAAAVAVLALLGLGGIADSVNFMDHRPEYVYYGALATVVLVVAWWGGAWHAAGVAASRHGLPSIAFSRAGNCGGHCRRRGWSWA